MIFKYVNLIGKDKQIEIPNEAYRIHLEVGGWSSDEGVYLWWKEYGIDKCKCLSRKNRHNLKHFESQFMPQINSHNDVQQ